MNRETITAAIAEDHTLLRKTIIEVLEKHRDIRFLLDAGNGRELLGGLETAPERPQVCILDISMPVLNGYDTARQVRARYPEMRILALSMFDNEFAVIRMLRSGAHGYVLKTGSPEELREAVLSIVDDRPYFSPNLSARPAEGASGVAAQLSEQELKFLRHICSDLTYKDIAEQMCRSPRTIDSYRDLLFEKLQVRSRVGLALFAIRTGIYNG